MPPSLKLPLIVVTVFLAAASGMMQLRADESATAVPRADGARIQLLRRGHDRLVRQIEQLSGEGQAGATGSDEEKAPDRDTILEQLHALEGLTRQQITRLDERQEIDEQLRSISANLDSLDKFAPDEPKPYSFLLLDDLKDQLSVEEARHESIEAAQSIAQRALKSAHEELNNTVSGPKSRGEKASNASAAAVDTTPPLDADALTAQIGRAKVGLKQIEVEVQDTRLELSKARQEELEKKIAAIKSDVSFSSRDRGTVLERLAEAENKLVRQRREIDARLDDLEGERKAAREKTNPDALHAGDARADAELLSDIGEAYQAEVLVLEQAIDRRRNLRPIWQHRYDLAASGSTANAKSLNAWLDELDTFADELEAANSALAEQQATVRKELAAAGRDGGHAAPDDDEKLSLAGRHQEALREVRDRVETEVADNQAFQRMLGRYRRELKAKIAETGGTWGSLGDRVVAFFNRDVAETDDESVTVGQMLLLASYVAGGVLLAYLLSRVLGRHLLTRLGFGRGTIVALRSIVFYVLCLTFGLVAFQVLDISLTAFAFIGGAAAIAIGFGSQDIMNNFMSGIILLAEQPIRVGDIVELSKVQGAVLHIGLRSTRLQTETNHEVIVPNKMLLDESVTNLTLSDNVVQLTVTVALERMPDVEKTKRDMLRIAFAHPLVVKSPQPVVLVTDFDSYYNQLTWEVHFWVQLTSFIKCAMVKSDVLERIAEQFPSAEAAQAEAAAKDPPSESPTGEAVASPDENGTNDAPSAVRSLTADPALMSELKKMGRAAIARELKRVRGPG